MSNRIITGSVLAAALATSSLAMAADDNRWYFSPALSYIWADSDRHADDDFGVQIGFGKPVNQWWNVELSAVVDTLDYSSGGGEYKQRGILADGLYFFNRSPRLAPYGVVGVGGLRTALPSNTNTNLMANVGVGAMTQLGSSDMRLRGDIRYRWDDDDRVAGVTRFGDWVLTVGLAIPFGGGASKAAAPTAMTSAVAAKQAPVAAVAQGGDSDGDGVADNVDKCPNTPAGAKVNASGCELDTDGDGVVDRLDRCAATPAGAKVGADGCELDSDSDGVVDRLDQCPATSAGAKVDAKGCEVDGDGDGIKDSADACPDTKAGAKVDNRGCELAEVIILKGVQFNTGATTLTEESKSILDDVATTLRRYPSMVVEVAGYTDNQGAASFNVRLSQERANSVASYLTGKGVDAANLKAKGYGPANPIADNNTAEGRQQNRRVELHILQR